MVGNKPYEADAGRSDRYAPSPRGQEGACPPGYQDKSTGTAWSKDHPVAAMLLLDAIVIQAS